MCSGRCRQASHLDLPASAQESLARVGAAHLREIATRDGLSYYVADRVGAGLCVTITDVYLKADGLPNVPVQEIVALDASGAQLATVLQAALQH